MSAATSTLRLIEKLCRDAELEVLGVERGKHLRVRVRAKDGREGLQVFSVSSSDHRTMQNRKSDLRRFARGVA